MAGCKRDRISVTFLARNLNLQGIFKPVMLDYQRVFTITLDLITRRSCSAQFASPSTQEGRLAPNTTGAAQEMPARDIQGGIPPVGYVENGSLPGLPQHESLGCMK